MRESTLKRVKEAHKIVEGGASIEDAVKQARTTYSSYRKIFPAPTSGLGGVADSTAANDIFDEQMSSEETEVSESADEEYNASAFIEAMLLDLYGSYREEWCEEGDREELAQISRNDYTLEQWEEYFSNKPLTDTERDIMQTRIVSSWQPYNDLEKTVEELNKKIREIQEIAQENLLGEAEAAKKEVEYLASTQAELQGLDSSSEKFREAFDEVWNNEGKGKCAGVVKGMFEDWTDKNIIGKRGVGYDVDEVWELSLLTVEARNTANKILRKLHLNTIDQYDLEQY